MTEREKQILRLRLRMTTLVHCSGKAKEEKWHSTSSEKPARGFLFRGRVFIRLADVALTQLTKFAERIQPGVMPVTPDQA